jgi:hypothetical protein
MLGRQQPFGSKALVNAGRVRHVRLHGEAGLDMGDQVRRALVADLGEVHLVLADI